MTDTGPGGGPTRGEATYLATPAVRRRVAAPATTTRRVVIAQQGAWDTPKESMPLAAGYLSAVVRGREDLNRAFDVEIANFRGGIDLRRMAQHPTLRQSIDVAAFSVLGWNYRAFGELAATIKQRNPDALVVFGGTHVAHQAARVVRQYPDVDVVVDGEGEETFAELLEWVTAGRSPRDLGGIRGISFPAGGEIVTTEERPRIRDLDEIPSPFLTGAIPLRDAAGEFPYDVALMETNRGCPYKCSFCYWGGDIGSRIRSFSRDRLHAELELMAAHEVETVVLCDSNFGMRRADLEFVEDLLEIRAATGFPRYLETSWAKNKSATFFEIVRRLKEAGVHSSFTLALQSLTPAVLEGMHRRNMQVNDWHDVVRWLGDEGLDAYGELIWGAPGDTPASFYAGYDELATRVPRIAVYPLLVLPNTDYDARRADDALCTVRGDSDDFEYVLAHRTMSEEENLEVQRFLFWARLFVENLYFRDIWIVLHAVCGVTQSEAVKSLGAYLSEVDHPLGRRLVGLCSPFADSETNRLATHELYLHGGTDRLFDRWWASITAGADAEGRRLLDAVWRYDEMTRPVLEPVADDGSLRRAGDDLLVREGVCFDVHVAEALDACRRGEPTDAPWRRPWMADIHLRAGVADDLDNHEILAHHVGRAHGWRPVEAPA